MDWLRKNGHLLMKYLVIIIAVQIILMLYCRYPIQEEDVQNVQNNLIAVSGILAGIVLAFMSAQFFQLKKERKDRQLEINILSDKLTAFRNILYRIMRSDKFWTRYGSIRSIKKGYPGITYDQLHGDRDESKELRDYILEHPKEVSYTTVDLYVSMEALTGPATGTEFWPHDRNSKFSYGTDYLQRISEPTNQIWYFLEGRYAKHTDGLINDQLSAISPIYQNEVEQLPTQINPGYRDWGFDRHLVSSIAVDFYEEYIPELIRLTDLNQRGVRGPVRTMLILLGLILSVGVILPLSGQLLTLEINVEKYATLAMVVAVVVCLIHLIFDIFHMHNRELNITLSEEDRHREIIN